MILSSRNRKYSGFMADEFIKESAEDELVIFKEAIQLDVAELSLGSNSSELYTLNENFIKNGFKKIKELLLKFLNWLKSITKTVIAKMTNVLVRDNVKFAQIARKRIAKMKKTDSFKYSGKVLSKQFNLDKLTGGVDFDMGNDAPTAYEELVEENKEMEEAIKNLPETYKKFIDKNIKDVTDVQFDKLKYHLDILETTCGNETKRIKLMINTAIKNTTIELKEIERLENKEDNGYTSEYINELKKFYNLQKQIFQMMLKELMSIIKTAAKISRRVVTKMMGFTPKDTTSAKNESAIRIEDDVLLEALIEADEFEVDEMLEESSCKDRDDDDDDDDDDDEYDD